MTVTVRGSRPRAVWRRLARRHNCLRNGEARRPQTAIGVSYWMNRLQHIPDHDPLFVTLNPSAPVRDDLIYDQTTFRHPVFDKGALTAQRRLRELQGDNNTWFAGAWTRHGFHEDGFASAVRIARALERQHA